MASPPIKLHVYDFDGTLFRSPEKPSWWEGGWWGNLNSLSPPCVPERPSIDWWNESVVSAAKQSIANPDVLAILVTGRIRKFSLRLKDLLAQVGLHFDEVHLSNGGSTDAFKMRVIKNLLDEYPSIRGVSIWEDRPQHLRAFSDWVESHGRACIPHLITVAPHESGCSPSSSRVAARFKSKKTIKTKDGDEATVYEYGPRQVANRHKEKAERVEKLRKSISDLRTKVKSDLKSEDELTRMSALAVALMDETAERVGNHESAEDGHFGVTGWRKKHITFGKDKVTIKYVGKSGVKHEKVVERPETVKALKEVCAGKSGEDCVFETEEIRLDPKDVNDYLKKFDVTAKDIRGFRANDEMCKALRAERDKGPELPRSRKEKDKILKAEFKRALEAVAEIVGHEAATLKSQYLVPGLEDSYLHDGTVLKTLKSGAFEGGPSGSVIMYHVGKRPPQPKPYRGDIFGGWNRKWLGSDVPEAVFLTDRPVDVGVHHGIFGNVYAYRIPMSVVRDSGGIHRFEDVREIVVPADLWDRVQFLGKSMDADEFAEQVSKATSIRSMIHFDVPNVPKAPTREADPALLDEWMSYHKKYPGDSWDAWLKRRSKSSTKTHAEKEDEQAEAMVKPSPKLKPPRQDLRKRRLDTEDDDLDTQDDDLSLNFKKVACRVAMAVRVASRFIESKENKDEEDEGDKTFMEAVEGKTFKHPETGNQVGFKSLPYEEQAKVRKEWKDHKSEADKGESKEETKADKKERLRKEKESIREEAMNLGESKALDDNDAEFIQDSLDALIDSMSVDDAKKFVTSLVKSRDAGIDSLAKGKMVSDQDLEPEIEKLKKAIEKIPSQLKSIEGSFKSSETGESVPFSDLSPGDQAKARKTRLKSLLKELGASPEALQEAFTSYYTEATFRRAEKNPKTFLPDTSTPLDKSKVSDRIYESSSRYHSMSPGDRKEMAASFDDAMAQVEKKITRLEAKLSKGKDSKTRKQDMAELERLKNEAEYLDADWRALEVVSAMSGDEHDTRMSKSTRAMLHAMGKSDVGVANVLEAGLGLGFGSEPDREAVSKLLKSLPPDQLQGVLSEVDSSGKLAEAWKKIYSGEDEDEGELVWPFSKLRDRKKRKLYEEAHSIFTDMLADSAVADVHSEEKAKSKAKSTKSKGKARPEDFATSDEDSESDYKELTEKSIGDLVELDIPGVRHLAALRTPMAGRVAVRFARLGFV